MSDLQRLFRKLALVSVGCLALSAAITLAWSAQRSQQGRATVEYKPTSAEVAVGVITKLSASQSVPVRATVGSRVTVAFAECVSTGYQWTLASQPPKSVLASAGTAYQQDPGTEQMVGGGGTKTFGFQATGKGKATLVFEYARPGEKQRGIRPEKTQTVTVSVE